MEKKSEINSFEDIRAWQVALDIANAIYRITREDPMRRDYGFVDQLRRAAVSIMNNVAEGYERGSNKDFIKFLFIARGSAGETRSMMYLARDQGYIGEETYRELTEQCKKCSRMIWRLIQSLSQKSDWRENDLYPV